jgi:hypothetical protein
MKKPTAIGRNLSRAWPTLNERERRLAAAAEAVRLGHGGVTAVSRATGLSRVTIHNGIRELNDPHLEAGQVRRPGTGHRRLEAMAPDITVKLESLLEPVSGGDLEAPLRWTCKSMRALADELTANGYPISHEKVIQLLRGLGYNLQGGRPAAEGSELLNRAAQFRHVNQQVKDALAKNLPVIAVNTMKKVTGAAVTGQTARFVNQETKDGPSAFAVDSINMWWQNEGKQLYPAADRLLIITDCGGSHIHQHKRWMIATWKLAKQIGLPIAVCHLPPGTSKWHNVAHRLFAFISSSWQGQPPCDSETIVSLIAATPLARGLDVNSRLDHSKHPPKLENPELSGWRSIISRDRVRGKWNYVVKR